jgi:phage baseplate assembly protein W
MAQIFNQDKFTPLTTQTRIYSDFFTNFDVHPDNRDLVIKKNEEAVKTAIRNLILTNKYERPFQPNFGSNIKKFLFDPINQITQQNIKDEIAHTIETYEPRANLIEVRVTPYLDDNAYRVTIVFSIININTPITLNTFLYRIR